MRVTFLKESEWEELATKAQYRAKNLARLRGLSDRHLQREFWVQWGCPPQHWLNEHRIAAAKQLLLAGHLIKQVAFELGFKQSSHFCRQFKTRSKMTPSEFIRSAAVAVAPDRNLVSANGMVECTTTVRLA